MSTPKPMNEAVPWTLEAVSPLFRQAFADLTQNPAFLAATTFKEQAVVAWDFLTQHPCCLQSVPKTELARFLGVQNDAIIHKALKHPENAKNKSRGRRGVLEEEDYA